MTVSEQGIARGAGRLRMTADAYRARIEAGERWCTHHQTWHPLGDFNVCRSKTDGVQNNCRAGNRAVQQAWRKRRAPGPARGMGRVG